MEEQGDAGEVSPAQDDSGGSPAESGGERVGPIRLGSSVPMASEDVIDDDRVLAERMARVGEPDGPKMPALAVVGVSASGLIDRWNDDAVRMFGRPVLRMIDAPLGSLELCLARDGRIVRRPEDLAGDCVSVIYAGGTERALALDVTVWHDRDRKILVFQRGAGVDVDVRDRHEALLQALRDLSRGQSMADEASTRLLEVLASHFRAEHVWMWRLDGEGRMLDRAPFVETVVPSYPHRPFGYEEGDRGTVMAILARVLEGRYRAVAFESTPPNAPMARNPSRYLGIRLQHLLPTGCALVLERSDERPAWEDDDVRLLDRSADVFTLAFEARVLKKQVSEQTSYLGSILESSDLGVLLIDRRIGTGWILLANERCRHFLGLGAPADLAGQPVAKLLENLRTISHDWGRDGPVAQALLGDAEAEMEGEIALGTPVVRVLRVRGAPARTESGEIFGRVLLFRDISQDKEMEHQLLHSQKMKSIGTLAGGIAHDFNNLLTTMLGYAELLKRDLNDDHPSYARVVHIERSARRAAELTTSLLAFSRRTVTNMRVLDLATLVEETLGMIRFSLPGTVELTLHKEENLPLIEADETHLQQVLINLVLNARDAVGERGNITISTKTGADTQAKPGELSSDYVVLEVEDDGVGIPRENLTRIFEPFYTTKDVGKGTGLGLSMVYGIVKQHNGFIEVTSAPGKGARFSIFLPPSKKSVRDVQPEESRLEAMRLPRGTLRMLIVDDEADLREFCHDVLSDLCKELFLASDGSEGIELLRAHGTDIDLVLLDLTMPRMSGIECFREMRRIVSDLRVIVTSGYNVRTGAADLLREGAIGFLPKPYNVQTLLRAVEAAMGMPTPGRGGGEVVAG